MMEVGLRNGESKVCAFSLRKQFEYQQENTINLEFWLKIIIGMKTFVEGFNQPNHDESKQMFDRFSSNFVHEALLDSADDNQLN